MSVIMDVALQTYADVLVLGVEDSDPLVTHLDTKYRFTETFTLPNPLETVDTCNEYGDLQFHVVVDASDGEDTSVLLAHVLVFCAGSRYLMHDNGVYHILNASEKLQDLLAAFAHAANLMLRTDDVQLAAWSRTGKTITLVRH